MDLFTIKQWLFLLILAGCGIIYFLYRVTNMCRALLVMVEELLIDVKGHE